MNEKVIPPRHADELDALRALSVWSVMLYHAGAPLSEGGWIGVDVFFVLSGFLITTILLSEIDRSGRLSVANFWARRALRLMPAYFFYLFWVTIIFLLTPAATKHVFGGWTPMEYILALWFYVINFLPLGGIWSYQHLTGHLWSLAVEQQFYLLMPFLLLPVVRFHRSASSVFGTTILAFLVLTLSHALPVPDKLSLTARGISLLIGCLSASLAFARRSWMLQRPRAFARLHLMGIAAALLSLIVLWVGAMRGAGEAAAGQVIGVSFVFWVAMGIMVTGYWYGWSQLGSALLRHPVLTFSGRISYGLYLYHVAAWMFVFVIAKSWFAWLPGRYAIYSVKLFAFFALTYVIASLSYFWLELPFLAFKSRYRRKDDKASEQELDYRPNRPPPARSRPAKARHR